MEAILTWLKKPKEASKTSIACLQAFRIISRDKSNMQALTNENALMTLNKVAGIQHYATQDADAVAVDIVPTDQAGNFNPNLIKFTDSFFFFFYFAYYTCLWSHQMKHLQQFGILHQSNCMRRVFFNICW